MDKTREQKLGEFVTWAAQHIRGDEKGEAQIFLDRMFQGFGHRGSLEVGGQPEFRIRKPKDDGGGTAFADYVWKPVVLIEMKKRGENLNRHYRQARDYWVNLAPNRPRYVILCNFDEFWIYDFDSAQLDTPLDTVALKDLAEHWGPLGFLFPVPEKPIFGNDHEAVTRDAANALASCFNLLIERGTERSLAQRFILQTLVSLFAEDIGLLKKYFVQQLLNDCAKPEDSYDLLGGLFAAMNEKGRTRGGRYKGVDYFNGGLFAEPAFVELAADELDLLKRAAAQNWSKVRPEIFGAIFEHSLGKEERHAFGAHYTAPMDIMKIVSPTIVDPWTQAIESAKTRKQLQQLLNRLQHLRVLDPACGSGNFLYMAYREMKRLEARLIARLNEFPSSKADRGQMSLGFVTAQQFYGLDINPFAVELAKVTMMIARKLAIDELHVTEAALPLDNLDANFITGDALIDSAGNPTQWPEVDVIIGNPPFLGAKRLKPEHGPDYVNKLRAAYPDVPGMADFCVYWFRKSHDHLPECTEQDPFAGRAGLVGTQNIRNNQSRVGGLDHIATTGTIIEAVDNQPWSGEANVHVSIANWVNSKETTLLPRKRRLWFKVAANKFTPDSRLKGNADTRPEYVLAYRDCSELSSSLSDKHDVSEAPALSCNTAPQRCFTGQMIGHEKFLIELAEREELLRKSPNVSEITFPYLNGKDFLAGDGSLDRFVIDFGQRNQFDAAKYVSAFDWVRRFVLPDRERKAQEGVDEDGNMRPHHKQFLSRWWQLAFPREELISQIDSLNRFIVCSRVTKRPIFVFVSPEVRPGDALSCFTFQDDYSFGILQSCAHWEWFLAKCSKLKADFRYSPESVFDTFPWPQSPTAKQIETVAKAGREVRRVRADALSKITGGLRAVYRTLELPGANPLKDAHAALDAAVLDAYGFSARKDLLAQLLKLNLEVAARIEKGQSVQAPGIPSNYKKTKTLITSDCIKPD